jgi:hypothetical protein
MAFRDTISCFYSAIVSPETTNLSVVLVACSEKSCRNMMTPSNQYAWLIPNEILPNRPFSIHEAIQQYSTLFDNMRNYTNSSPSNWLGVISLTNPLSAALNMSLVHMMLTDKHLLEDGIDIVGFMDISRRGYSFSTRMESSCPGIMEIFTSVLHAIHEDPDKIASMTWPSLAFPLFHGEFFAARPTILLSYLSWLDIVIRHLEEQSLLNSMTTILSSNPSCILSFPHLLASYYFNANRVRILTNQGYRTMVKSTEEDENSFHYFMKNWNVQTVSNITS